jgi:hypothetical protein
MLSERAYDLLVQDNLRDAASGADQLAADPERWCDALIGIQQSIQAQFTQHKAQMVEQKNACMARGQAGKEAWFTLLADERRWQSKAHFKLTTVLARLREAKSLRHAQAQSHESSSAWQRTRKLRAGIYTHRARLTALVEDDAAWRQPRLSEATRRQLRALLPELSALLEWMPNDEGAHGGSP